MKIINYVIVLIFLISTSYLFYSSGSQWYYLLMGMTIGALFHYGYSRGYNESS